jgi:hypothetical protein
MIGQLPQLPQAWFWKGFLGVVLGLLLAAIWLLSAPWPLQVRIANMGTQTFSVGWLTREMSDGCVLVIEGSWLPRRVWSVCSRREGRAHLVKLEGLKEHGTYKVLIFRGKRIYPQTLKQVKTFVAAPEPRMPKSSYGSVTDLFGQPVSGALVYVYPRVAGETYPEATLANQIGNFAMDLSIFGDIDDWVVEGGSGPEQWNVMHVTKLIDPFPPLEVNVYE